MRSIKFGILAIFFLITSIQWSADIEELTNKEEWTPLDYVRGIIYVVISLLSRCCILVCALTPVERGENNDNPRDTGLAESGRGNG